MRCGENDSHTRLAIRHDQSQRIKIRTFRKARENAARVATTYELPSQVNHRPRSLLQLWSTLHDRWRLSALDMFAPYPAFGQPHLCKRVEIRAQFAISKPWLLYDRSALWLPYNITSSCVLDEACCMRIYGATTHLSKQASPTTGDSKIERQLDVGQIRSQSPFKAQHNGTPSVAHHHKDACRSILNYLWYLRNGVAHTFRPRLVHFDTIRNDPQSDRKAAQSRSATALQHPLRVSQPATSPIFFALGLAKPRRI